MLISETHEQLIYQIMEDRYPSSNYNFTYVICEKLDESYVVDIYHGEHFFKHEVVSLATIMEKAN